MSRRVILVSSLLFSVALAACASPSATSKAPTQAAAAQPAASPQAHVGEATTQALSTEVAALRATGTATARQATAMAPPTATVPAPTATSEPAAAPTGEPATATPTKAPPTETPELPTATPVPPTATPVPPTNTPAPQAAQGAASSGNKGIVFGEPVMLRDRLGAVLVHNTSDRVKSFTVKATYKSGGEIVATGSGAVTDLLPGQRRAAGLVFTQAPPPSAELARVDVDAMVQDAPTTPRATAASKIEFGKPVSTSPGLPMVDVERRTTTRSRTRSHCR